jgi:hypothetical protein
MSTPKPRIKPKADPYRAQREPPSREAPSYPERAAPVITEHNPDVEQKADARVLFHEDDCLR